MNSVCLVIDRLHAGHLGTYGNSWIETPSMDRLAAEGFVFDQMLIDSPGLERIYRSYWQGRHALYNRKPPDEPATLAESLRELGVHTALISDDTTVARHPLAAGFEETIEIDPPWQAQVAEDVEQTHLARCFAQIIDFLQSAPRPFMLWCHLAGLGTVWDGPLRFRRHYWEEGDPDPPDWAAVPELMLEENYDPDQLLGISQAYAGQVSLLDTCVGALGEFLDEHASGDDTALMLTSPRGFPLGEHLRVGPCDGALYGELVQVPLIARFPDGLGTTARSQSLVEPSDVWATLLDYHGLAALPQSPTAASLMPLVRGEVETLRDRVCIGGEGSRRAIRTPAWYLCISEKPELFVKPDDRWEVNDVAARCRDIVRKLGNAFSQYTQFIQSGCIAELPPLDEVLLEGLE